MIRPSADDVSGGSEVLVVSHNAHGYADAVSRRPADVAVIDLVRLFKTVPQDPTYHGIGW